MVVFFFSILFLNNIVITIIIVRIIMIMIMITITIMVKMMDHFRGCFCEREVMC